MWRPPKERVCQRHRVTGENLGHTPQVAFDDVILLPRENRERLPRRFPGFDGRDKGMVTDSILQIGHFLFFISENSVFASDILDFLSIAIPPFPRRVTAPLSPRIQALPLAWISQKYLS